MIGVVGHEMTTVDTIHRVRWLCGIVKNVKMTLGAVDRRIDFIQFYNDVMAAVNTGDGFRDSCLHLLTPRTLARML